ncbi:hypothetical protein PYCC9005_002030 [Savitreella phatthalungensis]
MLAEVGAVGLLALVWFLTLRDKLILASYHPLMQSLGLVFLVQAVLILQPTHTAQQKRDGTRTHSVLHVLALSSFIAGAAIIWINKRNYGAAHYTTYHGKFGLATAIVLILQAAVGAAAYYVPSLFGSEARAKALYKWHRAAGYLTSALVLFTVTLGTQSTYFLQKLDVLWVWIVLDILIIAGIAARIRTSKMRLF